MKISSSLFQFNNNQKTSPKKEEVKNHLIYEDNLAVRMIV